MWVFLMSIPPAEVKVGAKPRVGPKSWAQRPSGFTLPPQWGPNSPALLCVIFNASCCGTVIPSHRATTALRSHPQLTATAPYGLCQPHWNASVNSRLYLTTQVHNPHLTEASCLHVNNMLQIYSGLSCSCTQFRLEDGGNLKSYKRSGRWPTLYLWEHLICLTSSKRKSNSLPSYNHNTVNFWAHGTTLERTAISVRLKYTVQ